MLVTAKATAAAIPTISNQSRLLNPGDKPGCCKKVMIFLKQGFSFQGNKLSRAAKAKNNKTSRKIKYFPACLSYVLS